MPVTTWQGQELQHFFDIVKAKTGGELVITPYWNGSLFPSREQTNAIKIGLADIGVVSPLNEPDLFPVGTIASLPFFFNNPHQ
jgi:TRAP-type C4-dicarboxylate transport system substrate-binding protein